MVEATFTIQWANGIHLRRAAEIVQAVKPLQARITATANDKTVEARSPLSLMTLGVSQGTQLLVRAHGPDEEAVLTVLGALLAQEKV